MTWALSFNKQARSEIREAAQPSAPLTLMTRSSALETRSSALEMTSAHLGRLRAPSLDFGALEEGFERAKIKIGRSK